jgi:transketolase
MHVDNLLHPGQENLAEMNNSPKRNVLANAIRALAMDAIQKANSGHPGMPMGMADIAEVLWRDFLQHNPNNPEWINRDRFILSNGHGAMLHYALLHLTGYDLSIEDLKQFRQLRSRTPGHPEYGYTPGVETTTGPLGQGLANAVGLAIAERKMAADFNRPSFNIIDHYTYVFVGDGCLMEGISHEVCSLAGVLGLGKLIAFYDDNGISIDGEVKNWFSDNTPARFEAYGWHVVPNVDGHNPEAIKNAILSAQSVQDKPSLICTRTIIAYGAPNLAGTAESHGAPLGDLEISLTRKQLGWDYPPFVIPDEVYQQWDARGKGLLLEKDWQANFSAYQAAYPELAKEFQRRIHKQLPENFETESIQFIQQLLTTPQAMATRKASKLSLDAYGPMLPELLGGSADLTGSNLTWWEGCKNLTKQDPEGNYICYGVREFGMFAIMNGIALHGGLVPYGGTFLTFVDYGKNAVRLSALMQTQVIYVLTHDSVGLGEDGPTHQPIEQIAMLRLTPGLQVWRPGDAFETAVAWQHALKHQGPTCLLLSRQTITAQSSDQKREEAFKGGYILIEPRDKPKLILIATGSELALATEAANVLTEQGLPVRVVSMPCVEVFEQQSVDYREQILPSDIPQRIAIEAGTTAIWYKYVGHIGKIIGIDRFGESAPYQDVYQALGLTVENIITTARHFS